MITTLVLGAAVLPAALAASSAPCPILNAYYPVPTNLASSLPVASSVAGIEDSLLAALDSGILDANTTTFSVEAYSLHSEQPLFTRHYTPALLASQRTSGVAVVDSDTVYRVGSVSKLLTVYTFLIAAGDEPWNRPITAFVPELASIAQARPASANEIDNVSWDSITVGALASQMAGIGRDAAFSAGLATTLSSLGLQDQGGSNQSTCGDAARSMLPCTRAEFFNDFTNQHPVTSPFNTPAYSNAAYQILGYALENITGQSMEALFNKSLVEPLTLSGTSYRIPSSLDTAIVPYNTTISWWDGDLLDETPAGGYYTTINDLRTVGKAILDSTLVTPAQTRRWMKPSAFTSNPDFAVGAPWEIMRAPGAPVSWMYTKSGDLGMYSALVFLVPGLGLGFNVLAAGENTWTQVHAVANIVSESIVPAMWAQARDEMMAAYEGTYSDASTNSTFTVAAMPGEPGLLVEHFTIGGQDVMSLLSSLLGSDLAIRLYPMGLSAAGNNGTTTVSWRAIFETASSRALASCTSWAQLNQYLYGGVGLDEFLFVLDATGERAVSVESRIGGISENKVTNATVGASRRMTRH